KPLHPELITDADGPDPTGHRIVGGDEMVVGHLGRIERWGEGPGPAGVAGELLALVADLSIRSVGDGLPPDDADVLDIAGVGLVIEVEQRVAAVLGDDQPRDVVGGPGRDRVGVALDGPAEAALIG